jgi:rod shape-determining protein MreC
MREFLSRYKIALLVLVLVLAGLQLAYSSLNKDDGTGRIGRFIITVYMPVHQVVAWPFAKILGVFDRYVFLVRLRNENEDLHRQNEALLFENTSLAEVAEENEHLKTLLNMKTTTKAQTIFAKVVARSRSQENRIILIDKGTSDGVSKNMMVLTPQGLVGHVSETTMNAAKVLLISDSTSVVDCIVQRTRVPGLVKGRGTNVCMMDFIHRTDDVEVGDTVISSGIGGVFQKGYIVGHVTLVDNETSEMFKNVEITPAVVFDHIEDVVLLPGATPVEDLTLTKDKP